MEKGERELTFAECQHGPRFLHSPPVVPTFPGNEDPCVTNYVVQSTSITLHRACFCFALPCSAPRWGTKLVSVIIWTTGARLPRAETWLFPQLTYIATSGLYCHVLPLCLNSSCLSA